MALYAYKGIGPTGKAVSGVKDGDSPKGVRALLRSIVFLPARILRGPAAA